MVTWQTGKVGKSENSEESRTCPVYQAEAATNAGASTDQVCKRIVEVHQAGKHVVLEATKELCAPASYRFANHDGEVHIGEVCLAFFMGDQPAHDKHATKKSKSCRMCGAQHDKLLIQTGL